MLGPFAVDSGYLASVNLPQVRHSYAAISGRTSTNDTALYSMLGDHLLPASGKLGVLERLIDDC